MIVRNSMILLCSCLLLMAGCFSRDMSNLAGRVVLEDTIEIVSVNPIDSAELGLGQKVSVEIFYRLGTVQRGAVWARPYLGGNLIGGYSAHRLVPVDKAAADSGIVEGWFSFDAPARIDEIRVFLRDLETDTVVKELSYPAAIRWGVKASACSITGTKSDAKQGCCPKVANK